MKKDELISMWQEGNDRMFRDEKSEKEMIEKYLSEKTLKGTRTISFNLVFYGCVQVASIILLSMNLHGYLSNPAMLWTLISQLVITIGILVFNIDVFYRLREINNYSESLNSLINKQLRFYRKPYEIWLVLASVSALILMANVNFLADNNNGIYVVNNWGMYIGISLGALLFIYLSQKISTLRVLRMLKAYLTDQQQGGLDQAEKFERNKRKYLWFWVAVFIILTASLVSGIFVLLK